MTTPENHTNHLKENQSEGRSTWHGFKAGRWQTEIDVRDFIQKNYTPYEGDAFFLCGPTERTETLWQKMLELIKEEHERGVLDVSAEVGSSITAHPPGYIDKENERIVGLQTDAPLKRAIFPFGGLRVVQSEAVQNAGLLPSVLLSFASAIMREL